MKVLCLAFNSTEETIRLASGLVGQASVYLMLPKRKAGRHLHLLDPAVDFRPFDAPRLRQVFRQARMVKRLIDDIDAIDPDVIHIQKWQMWFFLALPLLAKYAIVISIHDPIPHVGDRPSRREPQWIIRFGNRRADRVIAHNPQMRVMINEVVGISLDRIDVVPLIQIGDASLCPDAEERGNEVLFFGRLWRYKGLGELIRAEPLISAECPDVKIVIAGKGEDLDPYLRMMENPGRFEIHNEFVSDEKRAELFRRASVVVLPYVEATQSGVIPVAYTYGRPVVATKVGGLSSQVEDGRTGLLVDPGDIEGLAAAVVRLMSDTHLRHWMGEKGREKLEREWSASGVALQTLPVYERAISQHGLKSSEPTVNERDRM